MSMEHLSGFLLLLKQRCVLFDTYDRAGATARVDVAQTYGNSVSFVLLNSFMDRRETGWFRVKKRPHCLGSSPVHLIGLLGL